MFGDKQLNCHPVAARVNSVEKKYGKDAWKFSTIEKAVTALLAISNNAFRFRNVMEM